jgi:prepilin-type N-terminal cleavage/methylation domain-containing protein
MQMKPKCPTGGQSVSQIKPFLARLLKRYNDDWLRIAGFTFVEMMIVVTIIGLLGAIAVPQVIQARDKAQVRSCVANLVHLDESKQEWATDFRKAETAVPSVDDIAPYFRAELMPACPAKGFYNLRSVDRAPICSLYARGHTVDPSDPLDVTLP